MSLKLARDGVLLCFTKQKDDDTGDISERFSMADIKYMTKKFKNPIGKGSFGEVFRGTMTDGTEVAVKLLSSESSQGQKRLEAEVKLLKRASHQNLTPILGYCNDGMEMAIVYKYMPNGSLNTFLCTDSKKDLTWRQRVSIALGVTQGLLYLHECNFIHRDVKPENILLDEKLEAKLGGYGLVREFKENCIHVTTDLQGTHGYMDPEYIINYQLQAKSDVYSMGVVLLRLITGQPLAVQVGFEVKHITQWLKDVDVKDNKQIQEIVDPKLEGNFDMESVKKAFTVATKCASPRSDLRPNMSEVVKELEECLKLARGEVLLCFTKQKDVDNVDKSERFSMADIRYMTNNFKNPIGKGGFGEVFYGKMTNGTEVAVKLLSSQGHKQLEAEVKLLKHASHQNLTPILGYCNQGNEMAIVYKYMPNGSLNTFFSTDSKKDLTWRQRVSIALGVTQGLHYLHHECKLIHRDVKPENILLDENLEAKLGDYGLVREFKENCTHATTVAQGTRGYIDPEYGIFYQLREKSDVYSMGVVLLRLITGQPIWVKVGNEKKHITQWLKDVDMNDDKQIQAIVDPKLEGNFDIESVKKAFTVATKCASPTSDLRPNMSEVVKELEECLKLAS